VLRKTKVRRAHGAAHAGLDDETALDAGLPLDFEGREQRTELSFSDMVSLVVRPIGGSVPIAGSVEAARGAVHSSRRDAKLEAHLQPVWNVFGDFLEIFPKWYGATVPIGRCLSRASLGGSTTRADTVSDVYTLKLG
jgi:hypothetical protein